MLGRAKWQLLDTEFQWHTVCHDTLTGLEIKIFQSHDIVFLETN